METIKKICKYIVTIPGLLFILLMEVKVYIVVLVYAIYSYITGNLENTILFLIAANFLYIKSRFDEIEDFFVEITEDIQ